MNRDELLAYTCTERNELDAEVQRLRLENLALSAKLEGLQKDSDHQCRKRVETLEQLWQTQKKLEAVQAEQDRQSECERAMIGAVHSWSQRAEAAEDKLAAFEDKLAAFLEASRGEVVQPQLEALRHVCGEMYQVAGALGASAKVLDNLSAAAGGKPIPHASVLPYVP